MAGRRETEDGSQEVIFQAEMPSGPWWALLPRAVSIGAVLGLLFWAVADKNVAPLHLALWAAGGAIFVIPFALDPLRKSALREIRVRADGFTLVRNVGEEAFAWKDLEAAQFRDYVFPGMPDAIDCFYFRNAGRTREIILPLEGEEAQRFRALVDHCLQAYNVAQQTAGMPSFEHTLSKVAAWVFSLSIFGMLLAHRFAYHTLGTVLGLALMFTGTIMAILTQKEPLSRWVILGTVVVVIGATLIIWACGINLRDVLIGWEIHERRLGRPPW
jgi:hypothetical protein